MAERAEAVRPDPGSPASTVSRITWDDRARAVLPPYVLSRLVVLASLAVTRHVVTTLHVSPEPVQTRLGLFAWDASWYRDIARGGYAAVPKEGLRFFPLVPLAARAIAWLPGIGTGAALLLVANVSALIVGLLLHELARSEGRSETFARTAVWIVFLAPPSFVLVMGYAEATLMAAALVFLVGIRRGHWWLAAAAGVVAGLTRPVGLLLVVPALVEAWHSRRSRDVEAVSARAAAVIAPVVGSGAYLVWAERRSHDLLYPLRVQQASSRRGGWIDPVRAVTHAAHQAVSGDHLSAGSHLVTAAVLIALLVVLVRRWPRSYAAYGAVAVFVGLSARNLDSLERYSLSTIPLVLAAADLVGRGTRERVVLVGLGAALVIASILAFTGVLVP